MPYVWDPTAGRLAGGRTREGLDRSGIAEGPEFLNLDEVREHMLDLADCAAICPRYFAEALGDHGYPLVSAVVSRLAVGAHLLDITRREMNPTMSSS